MPRGGPPTYTYSLPPIYLAIPGTLITAAQHNTPLEDIAATLNAAWPVPLGGTGGTTAAALLAGQNEFTATQSWDKGADIASAANLVLGTDGNYFDVTGTTGITSISNKPVGTRILLEFDAALTITHNASTLILPNGGANITTAAGDTAEIVSEGTNAWRCVDYQRASGLPVGTAPGSVLQSVWATPYTANTDLTANIPGDDTIPQNTEGTQILTLSITPRFSTSKLRLRFEGQVSPTLADRVTAALFRDSGANAVAAQMVIPESTRMATLYLQTEVAASSTSATTFNLRIGAQSTTIRLNGLNTARLLGGSSSATLVCEEIAG